MYSHNTIEKADRLAKLAKIEINGSLTWERNGKEHCTVGLHMKQFFLYIFYILIYVDMSCAETCMFTGC